MSMIGSFLDVVERFCAASNVSESTLSSRAFNDGKRLSQIRGGADIGVRRLEQAVHWLSDHWPEGAEWPDGIARPAPCPEPIPEAAE